VIPRDFSQANAPALHISFFSYKQNHSHTPAAKISPGYSILILDPCKMRSGLATYVALLLWLHPLAVSCAVLASAVAYVNVQGIGVVVIVSLFLAKIFGVDAHATGVGVVVIVSLFLASDVQSASGHGPRTTTVNILAKNREPMTTTPTPVACASTPNILARNRETMTTTPMPWTFTYATAEASTAQLISSGCSHSSNATYVASPDRILHGSRISIE
jgi:hypothetical protein